MTKRHIYITLLFIAIIFVSCSTQKNTMASRGYNAMTAKYNTIFNGEQSLIKAEKRLKKDRIDNYTEILPLFIYSGEEQAGMVTGDTDRAIEKGLKAIQKRSITVKPKRMPSKTSNRYKKLINKREYNPAIKNAYKLISVAHLYNHNFVDALSVMDYSFREFPDELVQFDFLLWMAQTRIEMQEYENAMIILDKYNSMPNAPVKLYGDFSTTYGAVLIGQKKYKEAIPFIKIGAKEAKNKWDKTRRNYVLGQLYQITNQPELASVAFKKVTRLNPNYETQLNATINYAITNAEATNNPNKAKSELKRQANQYKNEEYRDQLYYAISTLYLQEKDTANALLNLKLSLGYNTNNIDVKQKCYQLLAELYFDQKNYIPSYAYYDSTMIQAKNPNLIDKISKHRWEGLKSLSKELQIINEEDSLQWLASLSKENQEKFVDDIIEKERLAQLKKSLKLDDGYGFGDFDNSFSSQSMSRNSTFSDGQTAKWYFYNPATVSMGKMEFEKRWGRRALQDNWRRSDQSKSQQMGMDTPMSQPGLPEMINGKNATQESKNKKDDDSNELPNKEELLANIPSTPEKLEESKNREAESLFRSGIVFLQHFNSYYEANEKFEKFIKQSKQHKLYNEALFWNYITCDSLKDESCKTRMRNELNSKFPNSHYAEYTNDPQYANKQLLIMQEMNKKYEEAYSSYLDFNFSNTKILTSQIISNSEDSLIIKKSYLLRAMAEGKSGNPVGFEQNLKSLSTMFPKTKEGILASRWLDMFAKGQKPSSEVAVARTKTQTKIEQNVDYETDSTSVELFNYNPDAQHYLWLVSNKETNINQLIFNVADYNFNRFIITTYDIKASTFGEEKRNIITVGPFDNANQMMDYYYGIRSRIEVFKVDGIDKIYIIGGTDENKTEFITKHNLKDYEQFFLKNYLKSGSSVSIDLKYELLEQEKSKTENKQTTYSKENLNQLGIEVANNSNIQRIVSFLKTETSNTLKIKADTKQVSLNNSKIIIVEGFLSEELVLKFKKSLENNSNWNNQIGGKNFILFPLNAENLKLITDEKSTKDYQTWINQAN